MSYILLKNCRELLTIEENAKDLIGLKNNTSLLIENERIKKIGTYEDLKKEISSNNFQEIDCSDKVVMPGYVDCHTHLIFGESRVDEYVASFTMTKNEIKNKIVRTGIEASIFSTRNATDEELINSSLIKLNRMLKHGTTTVEIKSGYGIDMETEIRLLKLINILKEKSPQTILSTYLGAHYFDTKMGKEKYIDFMINEVMPVIKKENLAQFCDVWCDEGYYNAEDCYKILKAGLENDMLPTLHTECYSAIGGAKVAAELKAANVGHLNYISSEDIKLLKEANVVGVLIPSTDFSVKHKKPFVPKPMLDEGMTIAIATNLNPGNWVEDMNISMILACRNHKMTENEAIRATTLGGAKALKIEKDYGSLEVSKFADIQIRNSDSYKNVVYKFGVNEIEHVIKNGKIIF
ncbi:imidazolonepropionase [Fusobacterium nucleatum]|uniref:Imidazolonepropionase n=1 Tax=Fusobacterium nucleatum subsp. nucleatum (strain ATCC 25586 / DSM 15643 / BCRC 10681 / CIP 101130 / JCM 8532 / KCTC 2640 / LMG 13131 / VPI 4355) TaxID=190304 RepID=Q8RDU6_FUSNN|nr:imidazolonepropionase [Fusobacterium nucleatum]ALF25838.1 imidazolonepropionase [Fusobacterium nucleatum subsp. nucleatum]AAL95597.1 Imidazolonepropionase [Fusobacterium nucleatum subsp. nucleatum ATCC 25586]AVQ15702.1 imidazolonepropionase [Fusobacterium nucleatum subsp. nucleatum ATCC 25586]ERT40455.1 imidazolonepropionase [Fusobacterium nucleatum CTI-2]MCG6843033.1 imidazolonepropionase [Fusobacterium nucleatum]